MIHSKYRDDRDRLQWKQGSPQIATNIKVMEQVAKKKVSRSDVDPEH